MRTIPARALRPGDLIVDHRSQPVMRVQRVEPATVGLDVPYLLAKGEIRGESAVLGYRPTEKVPVRRRP